MKRAFSIGVVLLATVVMARPPNYDESKVAPYTLEDPLEFADGTKLSDVAQWPARRAEIVRIFSKEWWNYTWLLKKFSSAPKVRRVLKKNWKN